MAKTKDTKSTIAEMIQEAKNYYGLQKEYLSYATAEKLTVLLSTFAVATVCILVGIVILLFACLGMVHWLGALTGNLAMCYGLFAGFIALLLLIFYLNRLRWVILPIARLMIKLFIKEKKEDENAED